MITIRPTAKLAKRMGVKLQSTNQTSTTVLGDWYAHSVVFESKQLILCISSTTRFCLVMKAAPYASFPQRFPKALEELLLAIGVKEESVQKELGEMKDIILAKTIDRSILGSLTDNKQCLEYTQYRGFLNSNDPLSMSLEISENGTLRIPEFIPKDRVLKFFGQEVIKTNRFLR